MRNLIFKRKKKKKIGSKMEKTAVTKNNGIKTEAMIGFKKKKNIQVQINSLSTIYIQIESATLTEFKLKKKNNDLIHRFHLSSNSLIFHLKSTQKQCLALVLGG